MSETRYQVVGLGNAIVDVISQTTDAFLEQHGINKNAMNLIKSELLRGREENAVDAIKQIVRYAAFTDGELGLSEDVEESMGYQILNIYEAFDFSDIDKEQVETNMELLRKALGLAS